MRTDMPDKEQTRLLFEEYRTSRDTNLRNAIVEQYLGLAELLASKYKNRGIEPDDLYQVACLALINAVERFDPGKGFEFGSFATPTIIGEIKKYFRDKAWSINVPRQLKELSAKIPTATEELQSKLMRKPTVPEIAEHLGTTEEKILEAMEAGHHYNSYSLNAALESDAKDGEGGSSIEKFTGTEEEGYARFENDAMVSKFLEQLSERERTIFSRRMMGDATQTTLAEELGVSQMTVSRIEESIRAKFRKEFYG